jgi:hypothetical protein
MMSEDDQASQRVNRILGYLKNVEEVDAHNFEKMRNEGHLSVGETKSEVSDRYYIFPMFVLEILKLCLFQRIVSTTSSIPSSQLFTLSESYSCLKRCCFRRSQGKSHHSATRTRRANANCDAFKERDEEVERP